MSWFWSVYKHKASRLSFSCANFVTTLSTHIEHLCVYVEGWNSLTCHPITKWSLYAYLFESPQFCCFNRRTQQAKKVVLVNSVLNLPDGQVNFFGGNSNSRRTVINPAHQIFLRLVEVTFGLVHASYSLPEWQAVKLTFFTPWGLYFNFSKRR